MPPHNEFSSHLTTPDGQILWFRIAEQNHQRNARLMLGESMHIQYNSISGDDVPVPYLVYYKDNSCEFCWGHLTLAIGKDTVKALERAFTERRTRKGHLCAFLPWCTS